MAILPGDGSVFLRMNSLPDPSNVLKHVNSAKNNLFQQVFLNGGRIHSVAIGCDRLGLDELLDQLVLKGVTDDLGVGLQIHLFQQAGAVGADGFCAQG